MGARKLPIGWRSSTIAVTLRQKEQRWRQQNRARRLALPAFTILDDPKSTFSKERVDHRVCDIAAVVLGCPAAAEDEEFVELR